MTEERRREIFSKEALTIKDVQELYDVSYSSAALLIRNWKRVAGDRIKIQGRIHIEDYKKAIRREDDGEEFSLRDVRTVCVSRQGIYHQ
jgi:hypothetical protein